MVDLVVVASASLATLALSWAYFRRYRVSRPPAGVMNLRDVAFFLAMVVATPYLYLHVPPVVAGALLAAVTTSALSFTIQPVLRRAGVTALVVLSLVGADVALAGAVGGRLFLVVNNLVLAVVVVGVTNLWVQSGMKARDLAVLGAALAVYDVAATWQSGLMDELLARLAQLPLVPVLAWGDQGEGLAIGLGDMLLAAAFPLAMRKGYGRSAGLVALAVAGLAVSAMLALLATGVVEVTIPAMVVLGPLMVVQHVCWTRRQPVERRTWEYLAAEPPVGVGTTPSPSFRPGRAPHMPPAPVPGAALSASEGR